jgi:hypothetical protein
MESSWRVHDGVVTYSYRHKPADSEAFSAIVFTSLLLFLGGPGWSNRDPQLYDKTSHWWISVTIIHSLFALNATMFGISQYC